MSYEITTLKYDRLLDTKETKLAWCVLIDDKAVYLPKSQVEDIRESVKEIDLPLWLVTSKKLEGYIV